MEYQREQQFHILAGSNETGGAFTVATCTLPPYGTGPPVQTQSGRIIGWYVLAGVLALTRVEETMVLTTGELQLLQPDQAGQYWNPGAAPTRLLLLIAPGLNPADLARLETGDTA